MVHAALALFLQTRTLLSYRRIPLLFPFQFCCFVILDISVFGSSILFDLNFFFFYKPYIISISLKEPGPFVANNPFGAFDPVLFVIPIFVYFLFKFFLSNIIRQPQSVALHVVLFGILNTRKSANNIFLVCHCFRTLFVII